MAKDATHVFFPKLELKLQTARRVVCNLDSRSEGSANSNLLGKVLNRYGHFTSLIHFSHHRLTLHRPSFTDGSFPAHMESPQILRALQECQYTQ